MSINAPSPKSCRCPVCTAYKLPSSARNLPLRESTKHGVLYCSNIGKGFNWAVNRWIEIDYNPFI